MIDKKGHRFVRNSFVKRTEKSKKTIWNDVDERKSIEKLKNKIDFARKLFLILT